MIGKQILHYKVLEELGRGGMGVVYKADDSKLERTVAIKFLPQQIASNDEERKRFETEAKAAASLNHPNIATIHYIEEVEDEIFIVMEYIDGQELKEKIESDVLSIKDILEITIQITNGIQTAHEKGVIHRDIKSANIMITQKGDVKIMDFGLAKVRGNVQLTKAGSTLGTAPYMSPEQVKSEVVDHRSDIFSLGVLFYEMLSGELPFKGDYEQAITYSIINEKHEPVTALREDIPQQLEKIVNKCLEKDPLARYQDANELLADLQIVKKETDTQTGLIKTKPAKSHSTISGRPFIKLGIIFGILVLLTLGYFLVKSDKFSSQRTMLVVLPFENRGPSSDDYFTAGITDAITARLAGIHGLGVISRQSAMQYKNSLKSIQEIGDELGVQYVVVGSAQRERPSDPSSRVRVIPQLIRVSDDTHLWAATYDEDMSEVFRVQSEIAERVVEALDIALLEPERKTIQTKPTENLQAYDYYLRGIDYFRRGYAEPDLKNAEQMFEKAVDLDPKFALAHAKLSEVHGYQWWFFYDRSDDRINQAKEEANLAVKLDPNLAEVHWAMGRYYYRLLDYNKALEEFSIGERIRPYNGEILAGIAYVKRRQGKMEEAVEYLVRATEVDPRWWVLLSETGDTFVRLRDANKAEEYYNRAMAVGPDFAESYYGKARRLNLRVKGNTLGAREVLEAANLAGAFDPNFIFIGIWIEILDKRYNAALSRLGATLLPAFETQHIYVPKLLFYALTYGLMGNQELQKAYYDSSRIFLEEKIKTAPNDSRYRSSMGIAFAGLERGEEAIREGEYAVELMPISKEAMRGFYRLEDLARIYTMVGKHEEAIQVLEHLLSIPGDLSLKYIEIDPILQNLRNHSHFEKLLGTGG